MPHARFVHLHVHTDYSLLDGACKIEKLAELASKYSLPALAITDHGNMFGAIEFYKKMRSAGIKPIIGQEVYMAPGEMSARHSVGGVRAFHLTLLVKNEQGYKNLMYLSSVGFTEGFYYRARIDRAVLKEHSEGLIGLSGCLKGEIPQLITKGDLKGAKELAKEYMSIFGEDNFYFELMRLGLKDNDIVNAKLIEFGDELGIPLVATNDCHYLSQDDVEAHDVLLCLQTHHSLNDEKRLKFNSKELYFKSPEEMTALFSDHPQAIENTVRIAEQCNLQFDLDPTKITLPDFPLPEGYTSADEYLQVLAAEGLKNKYKELDQDILRRFEYEMEIIKRTGYSGYFLIIKDLIDTARERGIPVGPGRGSTVGSLICYCLGMTKIDPLLRGLIFERFLNPERVSPPDIDIDFGDERRDEVIKYLRDRYGEESVCQIITFGKMLARAAIRDVGRVLEVSLAVVDRLAKAIPFGTTLDEAAKLPEVIEIRKSHQELEKLMDIATRLEGVVRHASTHAAGVAVVPGKLTDFVPLFRSKEKVVSTQYSMKALELLGIVKIDILGLRTLTVIDNALHELKIEEIPDDDTRTFSLLKKGTTVAVFQLESEGMRDILRKFGPSSIADIMAVLALYRPGPLGGLTKDRFIRCRHGEEEVSYLHPSLEPILKGTYGVMLYQEQVMQISSVIAGFSLGEADILRRAMGKKIPGVMDERRKAFIEGAIKNNVPEETARKLFDLMVPFAGYGFNKSHSAGYALLSYQTAWLKANYPAQFMASTLTSEFQDTDRIKVLIDECKRMKLKVLPPDVNLSDIDFRTKSEDEKEADSDAVPARTANSIRFGLATIKNLGKTAASQCVKGKPFKSFSDFMNRTNLNRKACESLIKAGAFDRFNSDRRELLDLVDVKNAAQLTLFAREKEPVKEGWQKAELLAWEKESFGFYFSGHPLEKHRDEVQAFVTASADDIPARGADEEVVIGGIVARKKSVGDKGTTFVSIEDFTGIVEIVGFSDVQEIMSLKIEDEILVKGRVSHRNGRSSVRASQIVPLSKIRKDYIRWVDVWIHILGLEESTLEELHKLFVETPGDCNVFLHMVGEKKEEVVLRMELKIMPKRSLCTKVRKLFGQSSIKLGGPPL